MQELTRRRPLCKLVGSFVAILVCFNSLVLFRCINSDSNNCFDKKQEPWRQNSMHSSPIKVKPSLSADLITTNKPSNSIISTEMKGMTFTSSPPKTTLEKLKVFTVRKVDDQPAMFANRRANDSKAFLVIGVPTVKRQKAEYLSTTLTSLLQDLDEEEKKQLLIVVMVTDFDEGVFREIASRVTKDFKSEVHEGTIHVVQVNKSFYPSLNDLPLLWKDDATRVRWRSKQCLDYAFLFNYAKDLGQYYLQIEDDVLTTKNYFNEIKQFIKSNEEREWSVLDFGARGFIGILYRNRDLGPLSRFVKMYHWVFPVDILFRHYNDFQLHGNPEFAKHVPPLFKHVGTVSSLVGQHRKLEDLRPGERVHVDSNNPPCHISTSITEHVGNVGIDGPYSKEHLRVFWGKGVKLGDFILLNFTKPLAVFKVIIDTGALASPEDYFGGGKLETSTPGLGVPCTAFTTWQVFNSTRQLTAESDGKRGKMVKCLKLTITELCKDKSGQPRWLSVQEIAVWTNEPAQVKQQDFLNGTDSTHARIGQVIAP